MSPAAGSGGRPEGAGPTPGPAPGNEPVLDDLARLAPTLGSLGWTDEHDRWADGVLADLAEAGAPGEAIRGRLARVSRGFSLVFTGGDALLAASGTGRTGLAAAPATGDFVVVRDDPVDGPVLAAIAERTTALQRRLPGRIPGPQVLAANVDIVFVMHGLDRELNLRRLERQLVVAWDSGAVPLVVLTKADAVPDPDAVAAAVARQLNGAEPGDHDEDRDLDDAGGRRDHDDDSDDSGNGPVEASPRVEVIAVSMVDDHNLAELMAGLAHRRSIALLGLSGIGKSSLVNRLSEGQVQRTGEVRAADRKGRHTTVSRDLIPLPGARCVIDTPGVREIGLWQAHEGLARTFPEIERIALRCRFANCDHHNEPGCEVRAAMARGRIEPRRLDHYRDLAAELFLQDEQLAEQARRTESRARAEAEDARDGTRPNRRSRDRSRRRSR